MSMGRGMQLKTLRIATTLMAAAIVLLALPAWALGVVPSVTAQPDSIVVTWVAEPDTGYFVWRSIEATSAEARALGFVTGDSFNDLTAVYGGKYYYSVAKPGVLPTEWTTNSVSLATTSAPSPHVLATATSETCIQCHALHGPTLDDASVLADLGQTDKSVSGLCLVCHETSAGEGISSVGTSFALTAGSGHELGADLQCSNCHALHAQSASNDSLKPSVVKLGGVESSVSPATNGWCTACHTAASTGADGANDIVDILGYPLAGTYPGQSVYENASANVHVSLESTTSPSDIARPAGSCLYCHASHRSVSPYGGVLVVGDEGAVLPGRFSGDVAPLCVKCHPNALDPGEATGMAGHTVRTAGGVYAVGTSMPCFACHNPHGSSRGNALNLSDTLGQNLDPQASDTQLRQFCFTCHTSGGYGWNSIEGTYTQVDAAFPEMRSVLGLDRTDPANALALESSSPSGFHGYLGTKACSDCHASSHNPTFSFSGELTSCFDCHSELSGMDASSAGASGTYHHVLGTTGGALSGGSLFLAAADPITTNPSTSTKYCVTCHTNHIKYPNSTGTLRASATESTASATSEFGTSATSPGLCISCHATSLTRNNTAQKSTARTTVKAIGYTPFTTSGHSYSVAYKGGAMSGSCVKCHNAAAANSTPSSLTFFGLHMSSNSSLIERTGAVDSNLQPLCFQCHSRVADVAAPLGKTAADRDWFNAAAVSPTVTTYKNASNVVIGTVPGDAERVFADMYTSRNVGPTLAPLTRTVSGHTAQNATPVLCSRCHDSHTANSKSTGMVGKDWPLTKRAVPSGVSTAVRDAAGNRPIFVEDLFAAGDTWISCFATGCHVGNTVRALKVHSGHTSRNAMCVNCHVPYIHGAGLPFLIADASAGVMPGHQAMRWYDLKTSQPNVPVAKVYALSTTYNRSDPGKGGCYTGASAGCHLNGEGPTARNWVTSP